MLSDHSIPEANETSLFCGEKFNYNAAQDKSDVFSLALNDPFNIQGVPDVQYGAEDEEDWPRENLSWRFNQKFFEHSQENSFPMVKPCRPDNDFDFPQNTNAYKFTFTKS